MRAFITGIIVSISLMTKPIQASEVHHCTVSEGVAMEWEERGIFSKAGIQVEKATYSGGTEIILIVEEESATLKGNNGTATLFKLSDRAFLEPNSMGDAFYWTLIKSYSDVPTLLVQQKAYNLVGAPIIISTVYACR